MEEYKCCYCGEVFCKGWSDKEANKYEKEIKKIMFML